VGFLFVFLFCMLLDSDFNVAQLLIPTLHNNRPGQPAAVLGD
jgi:hypothetical protein